MTRFAIVLMIVAFCLVPPAASLAGSAQDAFKKLQEQSGSGIKARSSSSSSTTRGKRDAAKDKTKKEMKTILNKGSKKLGH